MLGRHRRTGICSEQSYSLAVAWWLLMAVASLVAGPGLWAYELQQGHVGSAVVAPTLRSTGSIFGVHGLSCSAARGIFSDQGLNQCLLHWRLDSLPLSHQGNPSVYIFKLMERNSKDECISWYGKALWNSSKVSWALLICLHIVNGLLLYWDVWVEKFSYSRDHIHCKIQNICHLALIKK